MFYNYLLNVIITTFLLGIMCVINFVLFPNLLKVDNEKYQEIQNVYFQIQKKLIHPAMVMEVVFFIIMVSALTSEPIADWFSIFFVIILIWIFNFVVYLPIHRKLLLVRDEKLIKDLIKLNWFRTGLWTIKLLILLIFQ